MRPRDSDTIAARKRQYPRYGLPWSYQEDELLRKYAGHKTAEEMSEILGRPKAGIHGRIEKLGLDGRIHGIHHWNAKVDSLRVSMLHTLLDAGFTPTEVHRMFSEPLDISYNYLTQIACARYRRRV